MKIIVIGATGTIGAAVAAALSPKHEVLAVSRSTGAARCDVENAASVGELFDAVGRVDAVVSCAGNARFGALAKLSDEDFAVGLKSKLMGQINLARIAFEKLADNGSVTLTSGVLAHKPMPGSAAISPVNAALEAFAKAAALELGRGLRVNVVSPPWVKETMRKLGMDDGPGLTAAHVARAYVAAIEGKQQGETLDPANF